jgi:hypothetical protein
MAGTIGNKNAEKWTEEKALQLAEKLIDWLNQPIDFEYLGQKDSSRVINNINIFYEEFLIKNDFNDETISYLCKKFESFSVLIKKAKKIQETKLTKLGVAGILNPTMTIFCLKNHHGYKDKSEIDHQNNGESFPVPIIQIAQFVVQDDKKYIE